MENIRQTLGRCAFCGSVNTGNGMLTHLKVCKQRLQANRTTIQTENPAQTPYHLHVQDAPGDGYWLHLELKNSSRLKDLDSYLRTIWLECCGHLSRFSIGGWDGDDIAKSRRVEEVFTPGVELTHIYDFGESSKTLIKCVDTRPGKSLTRHRIYLMARNFAPVYPCMYCGLPATYTCMECIIEELETGMLCDEHAATHPHTAYGELRELVNSPRVNMCGYRGPAEPPY